MSLSNIMQALMILFEGANEKQTVETLNILKLVVELDEGESEQPIVEACSEDVRAAVKAVRT